jgi:WD40 repeat protein
MEIVCMDLMMRPVLEIQSCASFHNTSYLFAGIDIWRVKDGNFVHCLDPIRHAGSISVSPDGSMLAAACWDGYVRVIAIIDVSLTHIRFGSDTIPAMYKMKEIRCKIKAGNISGS